MSTRQWSDREPLPPAETWLLEASAGTGKTFQIANVVLRLVAEVGVPIRKILVITFTEAATAELRDRIRQRLADALAVVEHPEAPAPHRELVDFLREAARARGAEHELRSRLRVAVGEIDLAPISTIHGFCHRMLREHAFESGEQPPLELATDASAICAELVDDELARAFAQARSRAAARELSIAGFDRDTLLGVARAMAGPVAPAVEGPPGEPVEDVLPRIDALMARKAAVAARLPAIQGALLDDADRKLLSGIGQKRAQARVDLAREALGAPDLTVLGEKGATALDLAGAWKGSRDALLARPWFPVAEAYTALVEDVGVLRGALSIAHFARNVRDRVQRELARRRVLTFDGMLSKLADRVRAEGGPASPIARRVRGDFEAVFVDEFQDTDGPQWEVLEAAFHGHARMFLIGDPKQAIYAFRGANVHVYKLAASTAHEKRTMVTNFRSDPGVVKALNVLWGPPDRHDVVGASGAETFAEPGIDYLVVGARQEAPRLVPPGEGLTLRWLDERVENGSAPPGAAVSKKRLDLAAELAVREVLAWLHGERGRIVGAGGAPRDVAPRDLAVLVHSHDQGELVQRGLTAAGVPTVAGGRKTVFESDAAEWLARWLDGVAGAGADRPARRAVMTPLFGWSSNDLAWSLACADGSPEAREHAARAGVEPSPWGEWTDRLRDAARRWPRQGFARVFDREARDLGVFERLLARPRGERHATDLRHLFELLHAEDRLRHPSPEALADHLRKSRALEGVETLAQRLESDALAVRIVTIHASKGLEYPVVLLPFAWAGRGGGAPKGPFVVRGGRAVRLSLPGGDDAARAAAVEELVASEAAEDLRKLYVGLTRAAHRSVVWLGPVGRDAGDAAFHRLALRDPATPGLTGNPMVGYADGGWDASRERLADLTGRSDGSIRWEAEPTLEGALAWRRPPTPEPPPATPATFGRGALDSSWARLSFSALARASAMPDDDEKATAGPEPEERDDAQGSLPSTAERAASGLERPGGARTADVPSQADALPRLHLGGGRLYGSWVHRILEVLDFPSRSEKQPAGTELATVVAREAQGFGFGADADAIAELSTLLPRVLETPLDSTIPLDAARPDAVTPLPPGFTLGRIAGEDRLDELAFDLRLGAGSRHVRGGGVRTAGGFTLRPGCVDPHAVYEAIARQPAAAGTSLAAWLAAIARRRDAGEALVASLSGILTGSIDLVFRVGRGAEGRHFVVDYKTNRIAEGEARHFAEPWMDWEMAHAGYHLQSLIYSLALHRYLRVRLRGAYDPDRHLGGYLYLFLRGMSGPDTPRAGPEGRCLGVFGGRWTREVLERLDAALSPPPGGSETSP